MAENEIDSGVLAMDLFDEIMDEAQKMSDAMQSYSNFGMLTYGTPRFVEFDKGSVTEITRERFFELPERGKAVEIPIRLNVQEFNPTLEFNYERRVGVNSNDWFKHWRKSIIDFYKLEEQIDPALKGKAREEALNKLFKAAMAGIAGKYVEIADVAQEPRKNQPVTDKIYRTPELRNVFETREECVAAITARFGKAPDGAAEPVEAAPKGFSTFDEFADTVRELRSGGMTNLAIAKELDVSVLSVTKVK